VPVKFRPAGWWRCRVSGLLRDGDLWFPELYGERSEKGVGAVVGRQFTRVGGGRHRRLWEGWRFTPGGAVWRTNGCGLRLMGAVCFDLVVTGADGSGGNGRRWVAAARLTAGAMPWTVMLLMTVLFYAGDLPASDAARERALSFVFTTVAVLRGLLACCNWSCF